jgi:hypothetical protein
MIVWFSCTAMIVSGLSALRIRIEAQPLLRRKCGKETVTLEAI